MTASDPRQVRVPYPHERNDCDGCRERDADMVATYPGLAGRPLRWCQRCAGPVLAQLVADVVVTVRPIPVDEP